MAKIITITLNGVERRLDVGKFLFNQYVEEYNKGNESPGVTDYAVAIIYSGLMTDCDVTGVKPDFTKEDVKKWVAMTESDEVAKWMEEYADLNKKPGE